MKSLSQQLADAKSRALNADANARSTRCPRTAHNYELAAAAARRDSEAIRKLLAELDPCARKVEEVLKDFKGIDLPANAVLAREHLEDALHRLNLEIG